MRKKNTTLLVATMLLTLNYLNAQTNCDVFTKENTTLKTTNVTLSDENRFLKQKLAFFTELNKPTDERVNQFADKIEIKLTSVKGNRISQTVTVNFILINQMSNQYIRAWSSTSKVFDSIGNELTVNDITIGNNSHENGLFTDVPLKGTIVFGNVLPGTELIKAAQIPLNYHPYGNYKDNSTSLTLSNLQITW